MALSYPNLTNLTDVQEIKAWVTDAYSVSNDGHMIVETNMWTGLRQLLAKAFLILQ